MLTVQYQRDFTTSLHYVCNILAIKTLVFFSVALFDVWEQTASRDHQPLIGNLFIGADVTSDPVLSSVSQRNHLISLTDLQSLTFPTLLQRAYTLMMSLILSPNICFHSGGGGGGG